MLIYYKKMKKSYTYKSIIIRKLWKR